MLMLWFSCFFVHGLVCAMDMALEGRSGGELETASSFQRVLLWSPN